MNRLFIIGNGFDLAHGLPTSYKDFIDDFWSNLKTNYKEEKYQEIIEIRKEHDYFLFLDDIKSYNDFLKNLENYCKKNNFTFYENDCVAQRGGFDFVRVKNLFLKDISNQVRIQNWIDVENEYYRQLKKIIKAKFEITKSEEEIESYQKMTIEKLNKEFDLVKKLFENYLFNNVENIYLNLSKEISKISIEFYNILRPISIFSNETNLSFEFNKIEDRNDISIFFDKEKKHPEIIKTKTNFLNFNYTSTLDKYFKLFNESEIKAELNHIHGKLNDKLNIINFGFGDEMDDDYKIIENINDNEYLRNFKSFQYLQNSNYSSLLSYINSGKFQVLIMGHSCGLSDRTLLNTIFEHENCRSIKVFYHEKKDETGKVISDNYTEIIQNISRHFNKKELMREKIVNKTLCKPLPQIQLPKKE